MIDEATIAELKTEHGEVYQLTSSDGDYEVIVRCPNLGEWKRFRAMAADDNQKAGALDVLTRSCIVYPDGSGINAMLNKRPGLSESFGGELAELAGLSRGASRKKL